MRNLSKNFVPYKVTRQGYSVGLCSIEFLDPKNHGNKTKVQRSSLSTTRDRKSPIQGHVTLTYKITRQGYSVGLCCIEFPDPKNHGNKTKVHRSSLSTTRDRKGPIQGHVTLTYKITRQGYSVGLCCIEFPDPKNHGNKKVHRSSLSTTRDRKGPIQGHVTLTYKVTRQGYSVGLRFIEFPDPKTMETKKSSSI